MKRTNAIWMLILAAAIASVTGCGKDPVAVKPKTSDTGNNNDTRVVAGELVGFWIFSSATLNGQRVPLADALAWEVNSSVASMMIKDNGSASYAEFDSQAAVTYSAVGTVKSQGSAIQVDLTGGAYVMNWKGTWSRSGNTLAITVDVEGGTLVFSLDFVPERSAVASALGGVR